MHLAVLITNTDESAFAKARPDDGEKFAALIAEVRPHWRLAPIWVTRGAPLDDLAQYDGLIVTGSPASVSDELPWIAPLTLALRAAMDRQQKLFAACFGHQLVAKILGARIIRNPDGWGHGLLHLTRRAQTPWSFPSDGINLYGSHIEQVEAAPPGAQVIYAGPGLPVGGLAIGTHVFTVQHHPEMSHGFMSDLVMEYAQTVGPEVTRAALDSLDQPADRAWIAEEIARFFEGGR